MGYLAILLVNLVYIPSIWFNFVVDDATHFKLTTFNAKRVKIFSILLHLVIAEYIYYAFGQNQTSLIVALLFSVHPNTIQVSCWFSGRTYGINALIFLGVLAFGPLATPLYYLGHWAIGSLFLTPLVFLFTKFWYIALLTPVLIMVSHKYIKQNIVNKTKGGTWTTPLPEDFTANKFRPEALILVVKTFGFYALSCLLPMKNGFYNSFLATVGASKKDNNYWYSFNRHFWGGIFAIVVMAIVWWFNKSNFIGMGIMIFVVSLIPFLNFITVQQWTAPRYVYLPLIGFQVALVGLLGKLPLVVLIGVCSALFLFYLDRLIKVMQHYKTNDAELKILDSQVFPDNPRLWYFRYEHMLHNNNPVMAWAEATYGLKYLPEDCQLWFGLACATYELGDMSGTLKFLETSERFLILADRKDMLSFINDLRQRANEGLRQKFVKQRRF